MSNPLVSIIVPCYNQGQYLDDALQSVFDQSYSNWECIIVNDGSNDNTEDLAKIWCLKESRFKYHFQENKGLSSARNKGIEIANGKFILPLDADDKIGLNYTQLAIEAFTVYGDSLKVVYCKAEKFGYEKCFWNLPDYSLDRLTRENMIFCSAFYRKTDWELVGGYDVNMIYGLEDWGFWISILKTGGEVKRLEEINFFYRTKERSMITQITDQRRKEMITYLSIKHADFFIKKYGTFLDMSNMLIQNKNQYEENLKSEKFVIDLFCSTFFHFSIFGLYKRNKK